MGLSVGVPYCTIFALSLLVVSLICSFSSGCLCVAFPSICFCSGFPLLWFALSLVCFALVFPVGFGLPSLFVSLTCCFSFGLLMCCFLIQMMVVVMMMRAALGCRLHGKFPPCAPPGQFPTTTSTTTTTAITTTTTTTTTTRFSFGLLMCCFSFGLP